MKKIDTLVLSGGSVKGILFLGSLHFLSEVMNLCDIKTYIGTSIGAIIGYFLLIGYTPLEIQTSISTREFVDEIDFFNIIKILHGDSMTNYDKIDQYITEMTMKKIGYVPTMENLYNNFGKILICTTYNLTIKKSENISYQNYPTIPVTTALRMSSNLPIIFPHFEYMGNIYIDGGITNNFPLDVIQETNNNIIGLLIINDEKSINIEGNLLKFIYDLLFIPSYENTQNKIHKSRKNCSIYKLDCKINFFNMKPTPLEKQNIFINGYILTKEIYEKKTQ